MKRLFLALALVAPPAAAETLSKEIGRAGLGATATRLEALPDPTDADRFALGGVRFLGTVERALQTRWRAGLTDRMEMLPFLRLPMGENPAPEPFDPKVIAGLFSDVDTGMEAARAPLSQIPEDSDFGVEIALDDLWFDIDANGRRDPGENLLEIAGPMILGWRWTEREPGTPGAVIRFDVADAAWLSAYTHLLGGIANVLLAYDPTGSIERAATARAEMARLAPVEPGGNADSFGEFVDIAYVVLDALRQTPDRARAAAAHAHFLAMVADNRTFWTRVARETDNDREWLPNDQQQSALGIELPPGTGLVWQEVLTDIEALLKGERLAPYWRVGDGFDDMSEPAAAEAGVDVGRMFTDPRPIDLAGWIQGTAALPYLRQGPLVTGASWSAFEQMVSGDAMLFSLFLN